MIGRILAGAAALSVVFTQGASAQASDGPVGVLAAGVEQLGQSVGEAALGGSSIFVTARGVARIEKPAARIYAVTVEGEGDTAVEAAKQRDAKIDRLRAAAKRFSAEMTLGEGNYGRAPPKVAPIVRPPAGAPPTPPAGPAPPAFTASLAVRFARPPDTAMPAFMDALHEAGVEAFPNTTATAAPFNPAAFLGISSADAIGAVDQATWDKASGAAVAAARRRAEVLASADGRRVGPMRQVMMLTSQVQGGEAAVTVAARFEFAP